MGVSVNTPCKNVTCPKLQKCYLACWPTSLQLFFSWLLSPSHFPGKYSIDTASICQFWFCPHWPKFEFTAHFTQLWLFSWAPTEMPWVIPKGAQWNHGLDKRGGDKSHFERGCFMNGSLKLILRPLTRTSTPFSVGSCLTVYISSISPFLSLIKPCEYVY